MISQPKCQLEASKDDKKPGEKYKKLMLAILVKLSKPTKMNSLSWGILVMKKNLPG